MLPDFLIDLGMQSAENQIQDFLRTAPVKEILDAILLLRQTDGRAFDICKAAIHVRTAEDQAHSADTLERHTQALVDIAEPLLQESKRLTWLTVDLLVLTAGLLILTAAQLWAQGHSTL